MKRHLTEADALEYDAACYQEELRHIDLQMAVELPHIDSAGFDPYGELLRVDKPTATVPLLQQRLDAWELSARHVMATTAARHASAGDARSVSVLAVLGAELLAQHHALQQAESRQIFQQAIRSAFQAWAAPRLQLSQDRALQQRIRCALRRRLIPAPLTAQRLNYFASANLATVA